MNSVCQQLYTRNTLAERVDRRSNRSTLLYAVFALNIFPARALVLRNLYTEEYPSRMLLLVLGACASPADRLETVVLLDVERRADQLAAGCRADATSAHTPRSARATRLPPHVRVAFVFPRARAPARPPMCQRPNDVHIIAYARCSALSHETRLRRRRSRPFRPAPGRPSDIRPRFASARICLCSCRPLSFGYNI